MGEDIYQCMRPHGDDGVRMIEEMNEGHTPQIMWGMDHLPAISPKRILDVGCGGGIFTRIVLERFPDASADAIDISELCVDYSRRYNSSFIEAARLNVQIANVMDLPFDDSTFDLVVSNASHFFWSDLRKGLEEISRVTRKGGIVCLTAGIHFENGPTDEQRKELEGVTNMITDEAMKELMGSVCLKTSVYSNDNGFCTYIAEKV